MSSADVYVFDAYGTLLDVHSAAARHAQEIGPHWERFSDLWRTKQLEYTWVHAGMERPVSFWALTERSLDYSIAALGLPVGDRLRAELLDAYRELAAYPEVSAALDALKRGGARLAVLSNGDPDLLERALDSAGLATSFDRVLSVAETGTYKPRPIVYRLAVEAFDVVPGRITFCSSNRWDVAGASAFGFQAVWINRASRPDEYPGEPAVRVVASLDGLIGAGSSAD